MRSSTATSSSTYSNNKAPDNGKILENIRKQGANKQCFDCGEKGTTYAAVTLGTFVCSRCAGLLRDLNYKVKGIGVSNFTQTEMDLLTNIGNEVIL